MGHGYPVVGRRNVKGNFQLHKVWAIVLIRAVTGPAMLNGNFVVFLCRPPITRKLTRRVNACCFVHTLCFVLSLL